MQIRFGMLKYLPMDLMAWPISFSAVIFWLFLDVFAESVFGEFWTKLEFCNYCILTLRYLWPYPLLIFLLYLVPEFGQFEIYGIMMVFDRSEKEFFHWVWELSLKFLVLDVDGFLKDMADHLCECQLWFILYYLVVQSCRVGRMLFGTHLSILRSPAPEVSGAHYWRSFLLNYLAGVPLI